jgi:hypothetical protein
LKERYDGLKSISIHSEQEISDNKNLNTAQKALDDFNEFLSLKPGNIKTSSVEIIVRPVKDSTSKELKVDKSFPKGLKLPYVEIFENKEDKKVTLPHNPEQTTSLLTEFKNDGSGFKELVHVPFDNIMPQEILEKVKNHPNFKYFYKKEKGPGFKAVNKDVQISIKSLIDTFERVGIEHWNKFNEFPFGDNGSSEYTHDALEFKKNYRFGPKQDGYTGLEELIKSIFRDKITKFQPKLIFLPDERRFNLRGSFYTWVPSVKKGLEFIAQGINEHSNMEGISSFEEKEILIDLSRDTNLNTISLLIIDKASEAKRPAEEIFKDFRASEACQRYFRSICDWSIYLKNADGHFNINILKRIIDMSKEDIVETEGKNGFTHKLTFYGT